MHVYSDHSFDPGSIQRYKISHRQVDETIQQIQELLVRQPHYKSIGFSFF